jgi:hypothetical protein
MRSMSAVMHRYAGGVMVELIQWVVRGVDKDLARQFVDRAGRQRRPTGDILNEVLRAYLVGPEGPALPAAGASRGSEGAGDFAELAERVDLISDRVNSLCTLFEKHQRILPAILTRLERLEVGDIVPAGTPLDEVEPEKSAAIIVPSEAAGEPLVTGGEGTRRRLTPAGIAEAERMIRAGISDAEIAGRFGLDRGAIRQRRLKLEKSAIPDEHSEEAYLYQIAGMTYAEAIKLKGWTCEADELAAAVERWREKHPPQAMLPIEWTQQVEAMQKAGRSAEEIKAWLDLRKASKQPDIEPPIATDPASETTR